MEQASIWILWQFKPLLLNLRTWKTSIDSWENKTMLVCRMKSYFLWFKLLISPFNYIKKRKNDTIPMMNEVPIKLFSILHLSLVQRQNVAILVSVHVLFTILTRAPVSLACCKRYGTPQLLVTESSTTIFKQYFEELNFLSALSFNKSVTSEHSTTRFSMSPIPL